MYFMLHYFTILSVLVLPGSFQTCFINSLFVQKRNKPSVSKRSTALPHTRKVCITNAWYVTVELMIKRISVGFQNITNVANIFNSGLLL